MEEDDLLKKRFQELADKSYQNSAYYFTGFLSAQDVSILLTTGQILGKEVFLFGGASGCERQMARFGNPDELGYEVEFPISVMKAEPLIDKFAEELTHRDFLGALMNLGIKREIIGDIILDGKSAVFFVSDKIADYIAENFNKVKHTHMKCRQLDGFEREIERKVQPREIMVSSTRTDAVIARAYNLSRSQVLELFRERKVYINSRLSENNSYILKIGDVISLRGYGKLIYKRELYTSKKGKICLELDEYI